MKKITTQATITASANRENIEPIVHSVSAFIQYAKNKSFSSTMMCDIRTALSEAIQNVYCFAYPNGTGEISVSISIYDNNVVELKVTDYGCGIELTTGKKGSGFGFIIMEKFSDNLTVESTPGEGTIITMKFQM